MCTIDMCPRKAHILAFPFPAKGHINPLLHLCNRLASKGFKITFITTISTYKSIKTKATNINIESILDGVDREGTVMNLDMEVYFKNFRISAIENMAELIQKHKKSSFPPKVLIYDSGMPWMLEVAQGLGLLGASFFTQPCSISAVYYHLLQGTIKTPLEETTVKVPYLPPLESKDLPGFDFFKDQNEIVANFLFDQFSNIDKVDFALFNTFDMLEVEVVNWMASKWPILTVGPTTPSMLLDEQDKNNKDEADKNYLFETNAEVCLNWLDEREIDSVIYVSFGSFVSFTEEQMAEVEQGLKKSNCHFLWVVRDEEESKLSKDFKSETIFEKGLIINWCPQLDVLAHRAVACFMTHCGWNSTLEALSSGVPMIAVPQWIDQTTNAKFIADVWEAGVRVKLNENGIVTREEIEHCIREVTETERGIELKRNAMKWKELAKEAVSEGGSSDKNIENFASILLSFTGEDKI